LPLSNYPEGNCGGIHFREKDESAEKADYGKTKITA
jgi:hypothetical protein